MYVTAGHGTDGINKMLDWLRNMHWRMTTTTMNKILHTSSKAVSTSSPGSSGPPSSTMSSAAGTTMLLLRSSALSLAVQVENSGVGRSTGVGGVVVSIQNAAVEKMWYLSALALFLRSTSARWPSNWESIVPDMCTKWRLACFQAHSMLFVWTSVSSPVSTFLYVHLKVLLWVTVKCWYPREFEVE